MVLAAAEKPDRQPLECRKAITVTATRFSKKKSICKFILNNRQYGREHFHSIENRELSWNQFCRHWHQRLSFWRPQVPVVMTSLSSWQRPVFSVYNYGDVFIHNGCANIQWCDGIYGTSNISSTKSPNLCTKSPNLNVSRWNLQDHLIRIYVKWPTLSTPSGHFLIT